MYLIRARQHRDEDIRFRGHLGRRALPLRSATVTALSRSPRASPAVTWYPARTRFAHMGKPIRPTPVNPVRVI